MKTVVLLAAYNGEKYLREQLASLSAQTYPGFSVLYQDDGSSDRTPDILREWSDRDPRFRPGACQGRHLGAKGNFFSLLKQADADRVFLCDQDDIWEPDKIQSQLSAMAELAAAQPEGTPLLVHSDASVVDADGKLLAPGFFRLQGWDPRAVGLNQLLVQNNATGCMMLLNRPLAELVVRFGNPDTMFMHDWFIALTAASFGRISVLARPLVRYRQHGGNAIGASRDSLPVRAVKALSSYKEGRNRILLTYTHSQAFLEAFGDALPPASATVIRNYLQTRSLPRLRRYAAISRQGCLMQSPVTRLGQAVFSFLL